MRMWMVDPEIMCHHHLLGEHGELHAFVGAWQQGKTVLGFLTGGLINVYKLNERHDELVQEMRRRGWTGHKTPLPRIYIHYELPNTVDPEGNLRELLRRCPKCTQLHDNKILKLHTD